jgi:hypothetical protein
MTLPRCCAAPLHWEALAGDLGNIWQAIHPPWLVIMAERHEWWEQQWDNWARRISKLWGGKREGKKRRFWVTKGEEAEGMWRADLGSICTPR